jgi:hypothetical protein
LIAVVFAATGCATGTAHRLPLAGNPLGDQARACESACRRLIRPVSAPTTCGNVFSCDEGRPLAPPDDGDYGRCLDSCPGATAVDGASCPDPPEEGVVCVKTYRANAAGIAAGSVAGASGDDRPSALRLG